MENSKKIKVYNIYINDIENKDIKLISKKNKHKKRLLLY